MRTSLRLLTAMTGLALVVPLLAGTPAANADPACNEKIAYMGALTGPAASFGLPLYQGAILAFDQYNDRFPGCTISLEPYDTQGDPRNGLAVANRIINDPSITGVLGPAFSGEALTSGDRFAAAGLVTISPTATSPVLARQGWRTFHRIVASDSTLGKSAGRYVVNRLKKQRVAVVVDGSGYAAEVARAARSSLGPRLVLRGSVRAGQVRFASLVKQIKSRRVGAVVFGGFAPEGGRLLQQLDRAGFRGAFVSGDGVLDSRFARRISPAAAGRTHVLTGLAPVSLNAGFVRDYRTAFGTQPANGSAETYDAARVLIAGISAGASTRPALLAAVERYQGAGLTKRISFTSTGEVVAAPLWVYKPRGSGFALRTSISTS